MYRRNYRSGFSLIELLIVVAIIAALIGVAVPYFQNNLAEAQITKAKQDLDTIRNAINLYESRFKPLVGTDLKQILGQTMNEIPNDPWGNSYMLDANIGIIFTYGQDGTVGGQSADADQYFLYKPKLQLRKCEYEGSYGPPQATINKMTLYFTKPFAKLDSNADLSSSLVLRWDIGSGTEGRGTAKSLNELYAGNQWQLSGTDTQLGYDANNGIVRLQYKGASGKQSITSTMAMDLTTQTTIKVVAAPSSRWTSDPNQFGTNVEISGDPGRPAENKLGARIERKM